jgi:hypothetical protein
MDLRGLGESSTGWADYHVTSVAGDLLAPLHALTPDQLFVATLHGGAVAYVAATAPAAVAADPARRVRARYPQMLRSAWRLALPHLGVGAWAMYFKTLYPSAPPADFAAYLAAPGQSEGAGALGGNRWHGAQWPVCRRATARRRAGATLVVVGGKTRTSPSRGRAPSPRTARRGARAGGRHRGAGHYPHAEPPGRPAGRRGLLRRAREDEYGA